MRALFAFALLWLALIAPAHSRNKTSIEKTEPLPPESCAPPARSSHELSVAAKNDGELQWTSDLTGALKTAKAQHQEVLVYFRAEDCLECDQMQAITMTDSYIQTRLSTLALVRIDINSSYTIARSYGVTTVPAVVRLSSKGKVVEKHSGPLDKDSLLAFLRR